MEKQFHSYKELETALTQYILYYNEKRIKREVELAKSGKVSLKEYSSIKNSEKPIQASRK